MILFIYTLFSQLKISKVTFLALLKKALSLP